MREEQQKAFKEAGVPVRPVLSEITVLIPTLGRPILEESLNRIASGTAWPGKLIVVDQGSSSMVAGWLAELRTLSLSAEHVPSSQRGRAAAVNRGLERVQSRFVAVTDDDCFVHPDWLEKMAVKLRENPDAIISGRVEPEGDEPVLVVVNSLKPAVQRRPRFRSDSMCGGNMGAAIDVIKRIGLFDEDPCLRTAEDCEYSYRALRSGTPIVYAPDVAVRHFGWRGESERATQYRDYARSHAGFFGKYLRRGDWFIAVRILIHLLRSIRRWARGVLSANRDLALNGRAYVTELLPGIIAGWRSSRSV
jgi:GT2 family glycosyltransferase